MSQTDKPECPKQKRPQANAFGAFGNCCLSVCFGFRPYGRPYGRISDFELLARRGRAGFRSIGLLAAIILLPPNALAADEPNTPADGPAAVRLVASLEAKPQQPEAVPARSNSRLSCAVNGREHAEAVWQLAYQDGVIKQGKIQLDARGRGLIELILPEVRVRTLLSLVVRDGDVSVSHPIVLLPLRTLATAKESVKALGLGAMDGGGRLKKALAEEGAGAEELGSDLERDSFAGGCVILMAPAKADELQGLCGRFERRLNKGMTLVIVNPPAGWRRWGFACREPNRPIRGPVRFVAGFGAILEPGDLGEGPWKRMLEMDANAGATAMSLAWLPYASATVRPATPAAQAEANAVTAPPAAPLITGGELQFASVKASLAVEANAPRSLGPTTRSAPQEANSPVARGAGLIVVERVGSGHVAVIVLPQLEDPSASAVGGALLGEIVQWALQVRGEGRN
jgi:hypothetical protein